MMVDLLLRGSVWVLAVVVAMFVFWRRVRAEIEEEALWSLMGKIVAGSLIGGRLVWWLRAFDWQQRGSWVWQWVHLGSTPGMDVWGVILGGVVMLTMSRRIIKNRSIVSEFGDSWIEGVGWGLLIVVSGLLLAFGNLIQEWWRGLVVGVGLMVWYGLKKFYRKFSWYPSGRVGFLWWAGVGLVALGWGLVTVAEGASKSWVEWLGYLGLPLVLSMGGVYWLSGRETRDDISRVGDLFKYWLTKVRQWRRRRRMKDLSTIEQSGGSHYDKVISG